MMKLIKNNLLGFILGGLIFGGIVYGSNVYHSNSIEYSPTDSSWNVSNVNEAINDLYKIQSTRPKVIKDYFEKVSYNAETVSPAGGGVIHDCSNVKTITLSNVRVYSGTLYVYGILNDNSSELLYSVSTANNEVKDVNIVNITKYTPGVHKKVWINFVSPLGYINMSVSGYIERTY